MLLARWVEPQLCKLVEKAPSGPQWVHDVKFDGYRIAARIERHPRQLAAHRNQARAPTANPEQVVDAALRRGSPKPCAAHGRVAPLDASPVARFGRTRMSGKARKIPFPGPMRSRGRSRGRAHF